MTQPPLIYSSSSSTGMELLQTYVALQVANNIVDALVKQAEYWLSVDQSVAVAMKQQFRECRLEHPPRGAIYTGSRPGILGMPWDRFPAICISASFANPTPESRAFDQSSSAWSIPISIDLVVRSDEFDVGTSGEPADIDEQIAQEGIVDRRAKRTLEAIAYCISLDPSLGGRSLPLVDPTLALTEPFAMENSATDQKGRRRIFCYARAEYNAPSYSTHYDASQPQPSILAASSLGG